MPIIAKQSKSHFTPAPEGPQQAVCVDIVDLGLITQNFGDGDVERPMVRIVWHSAEIDLETHKPYLIEKRYTLSLHEKAALRKDLESWRGKAFTEAELDGFDLETLIGVNAYLSITHNVTAKGTWGNVTSLMRIPAGFSPLPVTPGYVRRCDREDQAPPSRGAASTPDDDIPF